MDIISKFCNKSGVINVSSSFLNTLVDNKFWIFISKSFRSVITLKKEIVENTMSNLEIQHFVALTTSSSIEFIVWWILVKEIQRAFLMKNFIKQT